MTLQARLDKKTGLRVLCGRKLCDGEFGHITTLSTGARLLRLNAGWQCDENGVYEQSRHARRRVERELQPRNRGAYIGAQPLVAQGRDPAFSHGVINQPLQLPIRARCPSPKCGFVNELSADALDVTEFDLTAPDG